MAMLMQQRKPNQDALLMGLEKLGMSVFPDCETTMEIPIVNNQFNLGFKDKKQKEDFEAYFGYKFDTPEGQEFLANYEVKISHDVTAYDIRNKKDAFDLHILKANGGMGIVAINEAVLEESPVDTFKFVVKDENQEVEERVKFKETKLQAFSELSKMKETNNKRLLTVAKYILGVTVGVGDNMSIAFDKLHDFIESNYRNAKQFSDALKIDPEYLKTVVAIRDAIYRNIIRNQNGQYVVYATQTPLGRNEEEVIRFLTDPKNQDILGLGLKDDSPTSIFAQLKSYELS